jgi:hypothetical protein
MWSMHLGRWNILPRMQYHHLFGSPESYMPNRATQYNAGEAVDISDIGFFNHYIGVNISDAHP